MNLADPGTFDDGRGVMVTDAAAGHDCDAAVGRLGKTGDDFGTLQAFLFAA
jgi:hypothetical protein